MILYLDKLTILGYRQERFHMNEDEMEEMITSVSKRIQAEIAVVKTQPPAQPQTIVKTLPEKEDERDEKPKMNISSVAEYSDPELEKECYSKPVDKPDPGTPSIREASRRRKKKRHHSTKEEPTPQKVVTRQPIKIPEEPSKPQQTGPPTITFATQAKKQPWKIDPEPVPVPKEEKPAEADPFALPSESAMDQFLLQSSHAEEQSVDNFVMSARDHAPRETNLPHMRGLDINESELEALMREEEYSDVVENPPKHRSWYIYASGIATFIPETERQRMLAFQERNARTL